MSHWRVKMSTKNVPQPSFSETKQDRLPSKSKKSSAPSSMQMRFKIDKRKSPSSCSSSFQESTVSNIVPPHPIIGKKRRQPISEACSLPEQRKLKFKRYHSIEDLKQYTRTGQLFFDSIKEKRPSSPPSPPLPKVEKPKLPPLASIIQEPPKSHSLPPIMSPQQVPKRQKQEPDRDMNRMISKFIFFSDKKPSANSPAISQENSFESQPKAACVLY